MYIWAEDSWPDFQWNAEALLGPMAEARHRQGRLLGMMGQLGFDLQLEAELKATVEDIVKTSAIEGEHLDPASVRSSLARRLGLPDAGLTAPDHKIEGLVEMMLDATRNHAVPLTTERLFGWHAALFPTGYSGLHRIDVGSWRSDRDGPMQVVSRPIDRPRVHYQAPPADRIAGEMDRFLAWFNAPPPLDGLLRSSIAHLWFVTLNPFDDGNGRMARTIADQVLAQGEGTEHRFYSVSSQIQRERNAYYAILKRTQKGNLDITAWLLWFIGCFGRAIAQAETMSVEVLRKAEFWRRFAQESLSARQKAVLNRFLDSFEGNLTARKWAALGKCSVDTAQRDINDLLVRGLLVRNPGGSRNTSYTPLMAGGE